MVHETDQTPLDQGIARLAERQHGVVALWQLVDRGLSDSAVRHRVAAGRLHRTHRGVYAVGHRRLGVDGQRMAAVLACGRGAVLSHRDAAAIHGLRPYSSSKFDVTSPRRTGRQKPGIRIHSGATLMPADLATVRAIPCTSVPRTLLDLAEVVNQRHVERAIDRAETLGIFDLVAIHELLSRAQGRRGRPILIAALGEEPAFTRNDLEELMFAICKQAGVPRPRTNYWIDGYEADFAWPEQRVIVETDGRATHGTRKAFEHDRARDRQLTIAGWRVLRYTWRQLQDHPEQAAAELRSLLQS